MSQFSPHQGFASLFPRLPSIVSPHQLRLQRIFFLTGARSRDTRQATALSIEIEGAQRHGARQS